MVIAGLVCLCAAVGCGAAGLWSTVRPPTADPDRALRRAQAPTQLAAGLMLAGGGAVALVLPHAAVVVVVVCVAGAVGTVAAGSWQIARYALRRETVAKVCAGNCASCPLTCASSG